MSRETRLRKARTMKCDDCGKSMTKCEGGSYRGCEILWICECATDSRVKKNARPITP